jgi:hypothetical protein
MWQDFEVEADPGIQPSEWKIMGNPVPPAALNPGHHDVAK